MTKTAKFSDLDMFFFNDLDWRDEAEELQLNLTNLISVSELIKAVLLNNSYRLTYDNIELAKFSFLKYVKNNRSVFSFIEEKIEVQLYTKLTTEEKKYLPLTQDGKLIFSVSFHPIENEENEEEFEYIKPLSHADSIRRIRKEIQEKN